MSILQDGEASGYDIKKRFAAGEDALFASASFATIYPALNKLEAKRHVTAEAVKQVGRPDKKIYRLTQAGQEEFLSRLQAPVEPDRFDSPFLYVMRHAHLLPVDVALLRITQRCRELDGQLEQIDQLFGRPDYNEKIQWPLRLRRSMIEVMRTDLEQLSADISARVE